MPEKSAVIDFITAIWPGWARVIEPITKFAGYVVPLSVKIVPVLSRIKICELPSGDPTNRFLMPGEVSSDTTICAPLVILANGLQTGSGPEAPPGIWRGLQRYQPVEPSVI